MNVNLRSRSLYAVARPSVCLSPVTFVHPTQLVEITLFWYFEVKERYRCKKVHVLYLFF